MCSAWPRAVINKDTIKTGVKWGWESKAGFLNIIEAGTKMEVSVEYAHEFTYGATWTTANQITDTSTTAYSEALTNGCTTSVTAAPGQILKVLAQQSNASYTVPWVGTMSYIFQRGANFSFPTKSELPAGRGAAHTVARTMTAAGPQCCWCSW